MANLTSKPLSGWRRFRRALACLNLAAILVLMWLAWQIGEDWWLATLIIYPPQHAFLLPGFCLLLLCVWKRERLEFRLNALALLLGIFSLLGFQIPLPNVFFRATSPHSDSTKTRTVRVMSYNILGGGLGIENVAQTIRAQNPDIICLQESAVLAPFGDATLKLMTLLPEYQMARAAEVTTISRFPIVNSRDVPLEERSSRAVLETIIEIDGKRMAIVNAHLFSVQFRGGLPLSQIPFRANTKASNRSRGEQFRLVRRLARDSGLPVIIAGDFNTPPRGKFYSQMSSEFYDAFGVRGWGFGQTFPAKFPLLRIDYLWSSVNWRPARAWTVGSYASDHRPLVAEYRW